MIDPEKITPLGNRVLVRLFKPEEKTKGGVFIPETTRGRELHGQQHGTLIRMGSNAFRDWGDGADKPAVGDTVLFTRYAGQTGFADSSEDDKDTHRIINDEDVTGVIRA